MNQHAIFIDLARRFNTCLGQISSQA